MNCPTQDTPKKKAVVMDYIVSQKKCSCYEGLHAPGARDLSCTQCMVTLMHPVHGDSHAPKKYNNVSLYFLGA